MTKKLIVPSSLFGLKVLITAGPTYEPIDPIRYIGNHSSGKMGYALAQAVLDSGAEVILVSGPVNLLPPKQAKVIKVITAQQMYEAVKEHVKDSHIFIAVAAVADYSPVTVASEKIKKSRKIWNLKLKLNPDILATVAALSNPPFTVGFAAETVDLLKNARIKLKCKKIDLLVANQVGVNQGFASDYNQVVILSKDGDVIKLPKMTKKLLAQKIVRVIVGYFVKKVVHLV